MFSWGYMLVRNILRDFKSNAIKQTNVTRRSRQTEGGPPAYRNAHDGAVMGLSPDPCNRTLVSSGLDGVLRTWDFKKRKLTAEHQVQIIFCNEALWYLLLLAPLQSGVSCRFFLTTLCIFKM